jgi:hypothetical protein
MGRGSLAAHRSITLLSPLQGVGRWNVSTLPRRDASGSRTPGSSGPKDCESEGGPLATARPAGWSARIGSVWMPGAALGFQARRRPLGRSALIGLLEELVPVRARPPLLANTPGRGAAAAARHGRLESDRGPRCDLDFPLGRLPTHLTPPGRCTLTPSFGVFTGQHHVQISYTWPAIKNASSRGALSSRSDQGRRWPGWSRPARRHPRAGLPRRSPSSAPSRRRWRFSGRPPSRRSAPAPSGIPSR